MVKNKNQDLLISYLRMNSRPVVQKMTKKARERKREADKADKALGGGTMVEVEGEDATKKVPQWYVELQWFRLLRGQKRLNQIARILVELAPTKVFDPRDIWTNEARTEALQEKETDKGGKKKLSKKDQIIALNNAKRQQEAAARDAEKLRTLGAGAASTIKLKTESGKLLLLLTILKKAVNENNVVDTLDTMWEIEEVAREVGPKDAKAAFKPYMEVIKVATEIRNDRAHMGGMNIADFQLTAMSDRLPPLNLHSLQGKFKLDDWQNHVIDLVNQRKSVLITAPTSSGKTVLSTYVCTSGAKVLFVVPTEPLAWQVAAMLRALKLDIAIVVPTLNFVPGVYDVVVGTPHSLESTLTKQVGFDFDYAVFDEVHALNNADGPALQRLIRAIPTSCKIMALSATIGNAPELMKWWETIVGEGGIELVEHKSRFINLQRRVWTAANASSAVGQLHLLHPGCSLSVKYLASPEYQSSDIAFTPVDAYHLHKNMESMFDLVPDVNLDHLKPKKFFTAKMTFNGRISLMQAKSYEDALKVQLVQLAKTHPATTDLVLASLAPGAEIKSIKKIRKTDLVGKSPEEIMAYDQALALKTRASMEMLMNESSASMSAESLTELCFNLHKTNMLPGICFQLDSVRCQSMFDGLLRCLEEQESVKYPEYRKELERKAKGIEKLRERAMKQASKNKGDDIAESQEFGDASSDAVDVDMPHHEFILTPPGRGMGSTETRDVQDKLRDDLPVTGDEAHPLIRGLRRGIGMYIEGLPATYHRLVQTFAQQGRLGVVFSDELLAYGVNMPFRSCIFFGDSGEDWLTPLLHQQMAGRAGRRGLDRQGHLVYAGFSPDRLRHLMRGQLPAVVGAFPLYATVPLQLEMNQRWESVGTKLTEEKMNVICATPLEQFLKHESVDNYYGIATQWVDRLGVLKHPTTSYSYLIPELVWELRKFLAESLALEYMLEHMIRKFKEAAASVTSTSRDADVTQQTQMFLVFCRICSRQEYVVDRYANVAGDSETAASLKYIRELPFPHARDAAWNEWSEILSESQRRIIDCELPYKNNMLLPVAMDMPLDNMCYSSFVRNQIDPALPTPVQHHLRQRIWNIGEVLRITSNVLGRSAELQPVQNLIRKAFVRIRYILDETSQRNWKKFDGTPLAQMEDLSVHEVADDAN